MQFEEGLGVKVLRVQAISFLPHLLQLILAALQNKRKIKLRLKAVQTTV